MKVTIEGTPEEIKNVLQAICGSEEHEERFMPEDADGKRKATAAQRCFP